MRKIISGPLPLANTAGVFGEGDVQCVVQRVLHAPVIVKVLHMLADGRSEDADEVENFRLLCSIVQRASAADQSESLQSRPA